MKKTLVLFIMASLLFIYNIDLHAQRIVGIDASFSAKDSISKKIIDKAKFQVFYELTIRTDPQTPEIKVKTQTVLRIGSKYSQFTDYNRIRYDSLMDAAAKKGGDVNKSLPVIMNIKKQEVFKTNLVKNYPNKGDNTFQDFVIGQTYQYSEPDQKIKWKIIKENKQIKGYKCQKATCTYRGRNYIAWFTNEVTVSEGPYVFGGLPGLIIHLEDDKKDYIFTANGVIKTDKQNIPIYLQNDFIVNSNREQTRKAVSNIYTNPGQVLKGLGITPADESKAVSNRKRAYNPIELE